MLNEICEIGVIGLGVMGRAFANNLADSGLRVAGYDLDMEKLKLLEKERSDAHTVYATGNIAEFCHWLRKPRAMILLVPAGDPVDEVIRNIAPCLQKKDLIIDSGNSHFTDTQRRAAELEEMGLLFLGMGMSGGETGARHGPSLMIGGSEEGYRRVKSMLEAAAAHVGPNICAAYLGPGAAGHYVKMVHNGIEYGLMQLIAETYDLMKRGLGLRANELHQVYARWNQGELNSYLLEITADIFLQMDDRSDQPLIDRIKDQAKQKGTGRWTVSDALEIQSPTPNIDAAVMMRHMSGDKSQRQDAAQTIKGPVPQYHGDKHQLIEQLEHALHAAAVITYAQGMALLQQASSAYAYHLNPASVARIWSGGCIIRAALLEEIQAAYRRRPQLVNLLMDPNLKQAVETRQADLRNVVAIGAGLGLPVAGFMMALSYWDAYRSDWLPANLIMAQRDYFGSHQYERVDAEGSFHTHWGIY